MALPAGEPKISRENQSRSTIITTAATTLIARLTTLVRRRNK